MAYQMDLSVSPSADARLRAKARQVFYKMKGSTHFSREELYAVLFIYFKLTQRGPMDKELFEDAIARIFKITDSETLDRIFMLIETPSHRVGPVGWARLLSTFCRGTLDEKVDFVFQIYDKMCFGYLTREAMIKLLRPTIMKRPNERGEDVSDLVDILLRNLNLDRNVKMTVEGYRKAVRSNPALLEMFGQCFPDRNVVYTFLTTFTSFVSTMHFNYMSFNTKRVDYEKKVKWEN